VFTVFLPAAAAGLGGRDLAAQAGT
jgi:hypothetical protein